MAYSSTSSSMFELLFGGDFKNFRPRQVADSEEAGLMANNVLWQNASNGRYGIKINGTAFEFAHTADLADFATESFVEGLLETLAENIKGGVVADGNTMAKLYALITTLQAATSDTNVSLGVVSGKVKDIEALLASNDINLDEMQELVDYIKANRDSLTSLSIANIAGLQAALDSKVAQSVYDAYVAANDAAVSGKVSQSAYDTFVTTITAAVSGKVSQSDFDTTVGEINDELKTLSAAITAIQNSQLGTFDATMTGSGSLVDGRYEYSFKVPSSKKIVSVMAVTGGNSFTGYAIDSAATQIKVHTVQELSTAAIKFTVVTKPV